MLFDPAGSAVVEYFTVPLTSFTVANTAEPFWRIISPVGTAPADCGDTVVVKLTGLPVTDGLRDEVSAVVVGKSFAWTVTVT